MNPSAPHRINEWRTLYNDIRRELLDLLVNKRVLWRMVRVLSNNKRLRGYSGVVVAALEVAYASYAVSVVRRLVDEGKGKVSLYRLLGDIAKYATEVSREWFVADWNPAWRDVAERNFDRLSGRGKRHLTRQRVLADQKRLKNNAARIVNWANEHVAHRAVLRASTATFRDLRLAIQSIVRINNKYAKLLRQEEAVTPMIHEDWQTVFYEPWIRPRRERHS